MSLANQFPAHNLNVGSRSSSTSMRVRITALHVEDMQVLRLPPQSLIVFPTDELRKKLLSERTISLSK
jgi:hypothetical protein